MAKASTPTIAVFDQHVVKQTMDDAVYEHASKRWSENTLLPNLKLLFGALSVVLGVVSYFGVPALKIPGTYPENKYIVIGCLIGYAILSVLLWIIDRKTVIYKTAYGMQHIWN